MDCEIQRNLFEPSAAVAEFVANVFNDLENCQNNPASSASWRCSTLLAYQRWTQLCLHIFAPLCTTFLDNLSDAWSTMKFAIACCFIRFCALHVFAAYCQKACSTFHLVWHIWHIGSKTWKNPFGRELGMKLPSILASSSVLSGIMSKTKCSMSLYRMNGGHGKGINVTYEENTIIHHAREHNDKTPTQ